MTESQLAEFINLVSTLHGEGFFRDLTRFLAKATGADYCFVAKLSDLSLVASTIAFFADETHEDNFSYELKGTPCEHVMDAGIEIIVDGVADQYPDDILLKDMDIRGYAGCSLVDNDIPVGIIVALFKKPVKEPEQLELLFDIFAKWAISEIRNYELEEQRKGDFASIDQLHQRLELAVDAGNIGIWEWHLDTDELIWNHKMYELYGLPEINTRPVYQTWKQALHPDDRRDAETALQKILTTEGSFDQQFRIITPHSEIRYIQAKAELNLDNDGIPVSVIGVNYDITRQKQAELEARYMREMQETLVVERTAELEKALSEAKYANEAKNKFLSTMSHELRTPMNAILGFTQLLSMSVKDEKPKKQLDQIQQAGNHLLELINQVMDFSRIESGDITFEVEYFSLNSLIKDCIEMLDNMANQTGIKIQFHADDEIALETDMLRLRQVIINLLSNAIKYNKPGGQVMISLSKKPGNVMSLSFKDTGYGLTEDQLREIFKPFTRFAESRYVEGVGIGLSICQSLVELLNGELHVSSVPGEGSCFTINLPI